LRRLGFLGAGYTPICSATSRLVAPVAAANTIRHHNANA
jgi:hypothetical protein